MCNQFPWGYGNEVLYRMCREQQTHTDPDIVSSKFWLIGRAYAAQIERGADLAAHQIEIGENEDFYTTIGPLLVGLNIDNIIDSVRDVNVTTKDNLEIVLRAHKLFMDRLSNLVSLNRRSFASKYLHFHQRNAFFIFDSKANGRVRAELDGQRFPREGVLADPGVDRQYAEFAIRCLAYRNRLEQQYGRQFTPREIDQMFIHYGSIEGFGQPWQNNANE